MLITFLISFISFFLPYLPSFFLSLCRSFLSVPFRTIVTTTPPVATYQGQGIGEPILGTTICSCSPSTYEFTLDFTLSCDPITVPVGSNINNGISSIACFLQSNELNDNGVPAGDVTDFVPVVVDDIQIIEVNQNLIPMQQTTFGGGTDFLSGDTLTYTTKSATPGEITNVGDVLLSIQFTIEGRNVLNEKIKNVYVVSFTNDCNAFPTLEVGQSIGWTRFVSFLFCFLGVTACFCFWTTHFPPFYL